MVSVLLASSAAMRVPVRPARLSRYGITRHRRAARSLLPCSTFRQDGCFGWSASSSVITASRSPPLAAIGGAVDGHIGTEMQLPLLCDVGALVSAICAVSCSEKQSCSASAACDGCDCVRTWLEFSLSQGGGRRLPGATLSWELMISSEGGAPLPVLRLQAPVGEPLAFSLPPRCLHSWRLLAPYERHIMSPMDGNLR